MKLKWNGNAEVYNNTIKGSLKNIASVKSEETTIVKKSFKLKKYLVLTLCGRE